MLRIDADEIEKVAYWLKNQAIPWIEGDLNGINKYIPKIGMAWNTPDGKESLEIIQTNVDSFINNIGLLKVLSDDLLKTAVKIRETGQSITAVTNNYRSNNVGGRRDMIQ